MGWKVSGVMDQRSQFVFRAMDPTSSIAALCREFGISRKTGYKWISRYKEHGRAGLNDLSRRPKTFPNATAPEVVLEIVHQRVTHPTWGPKKIHAVLMRCYPKRDVPARSTIARILKLGGFVDSPSRRRKKGGTDRRKIVSPSAPNDLWTVDYKGWWRTRDGARCDPLTVRDEQSRYILDIRATASNTYRAVRDAFENIFERNGLPKAILTDNGVPFAASYSLAKLTRLSAWWKALGIEVVRIDPGRPQQNGAHERMHRDIRAELERYQARDIPSQQAAFDDWRYEFNVERPHEALEMRTPAEVYRTSTRLYTGKPPLVDYPDDFVVRTVSSKGFVRWRKNRRFLSDSLTGWPVGFQLGGDNTLSIWFTDLCLGVTDAAFRRPLAPRDSIQLD